MRKFKNLRQTGYGVAGVTIGFIVYLILSSNAPTIPEARSTLPEFTSADEEYFEEDYVTDDEYTGDVVPLFPHGSYRVTQADFNEYERAEVVRYGKVNPMFYFNMPGASSSEGEIDEENSDITSIENNEEETNFIREESDENVRTPSHLIDLSKEERLKKIDTNGNGTVTIDEAVAAGYSMPIPDSYWLYEYMIDRDNDGQVGEGYSNSGGRGAKVLEGFNIHTTETERFNVEDIRNEFAKNAVFPVDIEYFNISSKFGVRNDPFTGARAFHAGVDFAQTGIEGANIYSMLDGTVEEVVTNYGDNGLGNYIVIDHGGFHSLYAHLLEAPSLEKGAEVKAGDVVGLVGSTGRSTGPHLHLEVGVGGVKFDALEFIMEIIDTNGDGKITEEEAVQAGFTEEINENHWLYNYMR